MQNTIPRTDDCVYFAEIDTAILLFGIPCMFYDMFPLGYIYIYHIQIFMLWMKIPLNYSNKIW